MSKEIKKRFPADTSLEKDTFLNNKKINGELYGLLKVYSYPDKDKITKVDKNTLPTQTELCKKLKIKSPKTYRTHLSYLIEKGYVQDKGDYYLLPNKESIYFDIPLETNKFLSDCMTEQLIKIYLYLGQRWKYKPNYSFTSEEIGEHIGISVVGHERQYDKIRNALLCLKNNGLIDYEEYYENQKPRKRLTSFSLNVKGL